LEFPDDGSASMGGVSSDVVTGNSGTGGRNRAFSFECFAFGINADEPLPPLDESGVSQPDHQGSDPNITADNSVLLPMTIMSSTPDHHTSNHALSNTMSSLARPRGDSIIFDPASFQDGGIHELLPGLLESGRTTELSLPPPMLARPVQPMPARPKTTKVHRTTAPPEQSSTAARAASSTTVRSQPAKPQVVAGNMDLTSTTAEDLASGTTISLELLNKDGRIGIYLPEARIARIARFHAKRSNRIWRKRIKYDCRKKLADSRPRIKGRFVKRSDMEDDM
jgi:CCT motif